LADTCLLVGDLGGTNARFALADPKRTAYTHEFTVKCEDHETAEHAISDYLERIGSLQPEVICLAAAGPVIESSVRFINNHWHIDGRSLGRIFPSAKIRLLNDFEAIAYSIPFLAETDLMTIGLEQSSIPDESNYTIAVLGAGTGLGEAGLMVREGHIHPIGGEGSHSGFAPENRLQQQVLDQLRERYERVSDERLLSGPGLENIYRAVCRIHGERDTHLAAAEIFQQALADTNKQASQTLDLFYEALGQVAGNLTLTLGAWNGIYIAGGIVKRYPELLESSKFRSGFENKGRYRSIMEKIPTLLITHSEPGLLGASYCARQL